MKIELLKLYCGRRGTFSAGTELDVPAEEARQLVAAGAARDLHQAEAEAEAKAKADAEAKVKAEQEALQALNEKKQRITEAEAAAQERILTADAEAYKTKVEAEAKAGAIDAEGEALKRNPKLIDMRAVERWDGVLPRIMTGGGGMIPFLNLSAENSGGTGTK